jgi:hypothetical protein
VVCQVPDGGHVEAGHHKKNPHGTITNSDLELAASILQKDIAAHHFDIHVATVS